jgi:hypothetical protein
LLCQDKTWKSTEQCEEAFLETKETPKIWATNALWTVIAHPTTLWC